MAFATILHTNDLHNHLRPEQAIRLKELRGQLGTRGLLLDAGDAVSSGNLSYRTGGEPILGVMSDIGYDAITVGNREFHFTQAGFHAKLSQARFPVLCANVTRREHGGDPDKSDGELPVEESIRRTVAGRLRVTVFGLTVPMITERMLVRRVSSYVFHDPNRIAARLAPRLRADCDLLVCLSHIGLARDRELAESVRGIDLIVGGHSHVALPEGERAGGTLIVQAGWWGKLLGRVEIALEGGRPVLSASVCPL